ncbi:MAG: SDR family oxidoreductase [Cyanobacteria bacterium J06626_6]
MAHEMASRATDQKTNREAQHAIITGGSSGIGLAIARQLASQGAHISILARGEDKLQRAKRDIETTTKNDTQRVLMLPADVSDRTQAETAIKTAIAQLGPPHLLVTSAGIAHPGHFEAMGADIFERTMAVNYFGTLYCIRAALPAMAQQGKGQICMMSSGAGLIGIYGYSAYCPSKFAVRGLAETLRAELKPMGIGVAIAYPPDTDTPQLTAENKTKPAATKQITAAAKLWQPEDIARVILSGLERQAFEISPGTEMRLLTRLHSLAAPLINPYFDRIVARQWVDEQ